MAQSTRMIAFEGSQTIANVEAACQRLREAIAGGAGVDVDLSKVTDADLAFVQVLIALRRQAQAKGGGLRIKCSGSGAVASAVARGGLTPSTTLNDLPAKGEPL